MVRDRFFKADLQKDHDHHNDDYDDKIHHDPYGESDHRSQGDHRPQGDHCS